MAAEFFARRLFRWNPERSGEFHYVRRFLTSGELSTALRPFYFTVHPDLFGQYPSERAVNESSLQVLSSYIQNLQQNRYPRPTTITFYLKPQRSQGKYQVKLKAVNIRLTQRDLKKTVTSILSTCDLPTTYIDQIKVEEKKEDNFRGFKFTSDDYNYEETLRQKQTDAANARQKLLYWLKKNAGVAKEKLATCKATREEVVKLQQEICETLELKEIIWDCGWNITHFRGCLQSFQALTEHHGDVMSVLKGRTLVFGNDTGVSFDGLVLLNSGEVRHNWLDFIKNITKEDDILKTVPGFEKALSRVLRDIQIVQRKFQPKTMANQYEINLRRLTTSLSDYQGSKGYPKAWPDSLKKYELVVETGAGPLMVSPTGQFIVPCSCPSFLLVNFISENLKKADDLLHEYKTHKNVEKLLHSRCLDEFQLVALDKDDSITPQLMITCCETLLKDKDILGDFLAGTRLTITNYFSVMSDGEICIPWNWKSMEDF